MCCFLFSPFLFVFVVLFLIVELLSSAELLVVAINVWLQFKVLEDTRLCKRTDVEIIMTTPDVHFAEPLRATRIDLTRQHVAAAPENILRLEPGANFLSSELPKSFVAMFRCG